MSATAVLPTIRVLTVADLAARFGPMPLTRFRFDPRPGAATEQDVLDIHRREKRLYELVAGILVEKVMGYPESALAFELGRLLGNWVAPRRLGIVAGADGMMRPHEPTRPHPGRVVRLLGSVSRSEDDPRGAAQPDPRSRRRGAQREQHRRGNG